MNIKPHKNKIILIFVTISISCAFTITSEYNEKQEIRNKNIEIKQNNLGEKIKNNLIDNGLKKEIANKKVKKYDWGIINEYINDLSIIASINKSKLFKEIEKKVLKDEEINFNNYSSIMGLLQRVGKFILTEKEKEKINQLSKV